MSAKPYHWGVDLTLTIIVVSAGIILGRDNIQSYSTSLVDINGDGLIDIVSEQ